MVKKNLTSLWWMNLSHKRIDIPNQTCQSTQKRDTFGLGAPVLYRTKTLGHENQ